MRQVKAACLEETTVTLFLDRKLEVERVRGLEEHIDRCARCRRLLAELARGTEPPVPGTPPEDCAGVRIDRYVLLRRIGEGGMGVVYAAYDPTLDRRVAVKLVHADGDEASRARLAQEARALAKVSSENVVAVFDAGVVDDQVFVAMELVEGGTLGSWLRERRRSWREVVRVFERAGRGLAAAHANGLVHRDFKPDNVLIDGDRVRVADFGLAAPDAELRSSPRSVAGTPGYMSPEHFAGAVVDARSDQFAYCVAFYEALYGLRPFAGDTLDALDAEVTAGRVRPPPTRAAPAWLRGVITRGLATDPEARWPSMPALLAALARRTIFRRAGWIAAAAVALAGTSAGLAMRATESPAPCASAGERPALAYDPRAMRAAFGASAPGGAAAADRVIARLEVWRTGIGEARATACHATRIAERESPELFDLRMLCLARNVERVSALMAELGKPTPYVVDVALAEVNRAADFAECTASPRALLEPLREPSDPVARARHDELRQHLARAQAARAAGRYGEAANAAAEIAKQAASIPARALEAEAWRLEGEARDDDRDYAVARAALERGLVAAEASGHDRLRAAVYLILANVENKLDGRANAERWVAQARALVDRLQLASFAASVTYHEGLLAVWRDDYAAAVPFLRRALAEHERAHGAEDATIHILTSLGLALWQQGAPDEARAHLKRAVAIGERVLGERHPALLRPLYLRSAIATVAGDYPTAIALGRRGFDIARVHTGPNGTLLVQNTVALATALSEAGEIDDALVLLGQAIAAYEQSIGTDTAMLATMLVLRAQALANAARFAEALADQERAVAIVRKQLGPTDDDLAVALEGYGRVLQGLRRWDDSIAAYREAASIRATRGEAEQSYYAEQGIALSLQGAGRHADAIAYFERAIAARTNVAGVDPTELADVQLGLARTLLALRRDRPRTLTLLRAARATYADRAADSTRLAEIDALLAR